MTNSAFTAGRFTGCLILSLMLLAFVTATTSAATFSNTAAIAPVDRPSNNAGTDPGLPPLYPSLINVTGLTGTITKVTVSFNLTTTFPDDVDIMLVHPNGTTRTLIMSDAGGSGDITGVAFTFDQAAAATVADGPTTPLPAGSYRPSNYAGLATPEPGGADNFPAPGGGLQVFPAPTLDVFNGLSPNGNWALYVVDDQAIDVSSLPNGWSISIDAGPAVPVQNYLDFNGDNKTDFTVVRNTGGGPTGAITWFTQYNGVAGGQTDNWGIATDFFVPGNYDADNKTDVTVWRPASAGSAAFYILQSATSTLRTELFGQSGDDPRVVGDYNNDGRDDVSVYRAGASAGDPSTWYYRQAVAGPVFAVQWGQNGDFPAPGDYDGDGSADFVVQRNAGGGQARFWRRFAAGSSDSVVFGTPTDVIVPGDYDGDGKTDIATIRGSGGIIIWFYLPSSGGSYVGPIPFGNSATDFPTQGDYDGDGKTDISTWRPSADPTQNFFRYQGTTSGYAALEWGQNGDYPVANYNAH